MALLRVRAHRGPSTLQSSSTLFHIFYQVPRRTVGASVDLTGALFHSAGVLLEVLPPESTGQHSNMGIGVTGDVGQDMSDAPTRQLTLPTRRVVV